MVTRTEDREIGVVSGRLPGNPGARVGMYALRTGRESYGHTVQSVAARSIVQKFLKRSPAWTKPERVLMGLL